IGIVAIGGNGTTLPFQFGLEQVHGGGVLRLGFIWFGVGFWGLGVGSWLLAIGSWELDVGCWMFC
ncbi:MAG: hypothetical protein ACK4XL_06500, partial [Bacteroidota bacterium]